MTTVVNLQNQKEIDGSVTLKGLAVQLGINIGISFVALCVFNVLRPNNSLVYAPKYKYASPAKQPPKVGRGFFDWIKPVVTTGEDELIEKIGFDAVLFIRFMAICRRILYVMTVVGVFCLIPVNIIATFYTGTWPPNTGVDFLSISTINSGNNEELRWYWAHVGATWLFSLTIYWFLYSAYTSYVSFRRKYFESEEYQNSMHAKTLAVLNVPQAMQSDERLAQWIQSFKLPYPVAQASIGRKADKLPELMEKHEHAVRDLEGALAGYLQDGKTGAKRPKATIGGFLGCGGKSVDAIEYYTKEVQELEAEISQSRARLHSLKPTNYGWISFDRISYAHATGMQLAKGLPMELKTKSADTPIIQMSPSPKDIIWSNLAQNQHVRNTKRFVGTIIFVTFTITWTIPLGLLSAAANLKNIVKIWPQSAHFLASNQFVSGLIQSWLSPIIMAIFFFLLPKLLRLLSQQQGSLTESSLDRQVLGKLYLFFIFNNLFAFTISGCVLSTFGQLREEIYSGEATPQTLWNDVYKNLNIIAENLADVSNFWINYVSLRGLGIILDLAQIVALVTITLRKVFTHPTPRQLREFTRPPDFDYPLFYNILLFFFTVGLLYSVVAPLMLPFTLFYFVLCTMVFRYLLMYVYTTKIETGGQIWRVLFNRLIASTVIFQLVMLGVLNLKGGHWQSIALIPLPFASIAFKFVCKNQFDSKIYYYIPRDGHDGIESRKDGSGKHRLSQRFGHPAFYSELATPMVHANVKHLLPEVYNSRARETSKTITSGLTRKTSTRKLEVINGINGGNDIKFQAIEQSELEVDDSREGISGAYKFDEGDQLLENAAAPAIHGALPTRDTSFASTATAHRPSSHQSSYPTAISPESPNSRAYSPAAPSTPGSIRGREYISPPREYMPTPSPNRSNPASPTALSLLLPGNTEYYSTDHGHAQNDPSLAEAEVIELERMQGGGMDSRWSEKEEVEAGSTSPYGIDANNQLGEDYTAYGADSPHSLAQNIHPGANEFYSSQFSSDYGYQAFSEPQPPTLVYDEPQEAVDQYGLPVSQNHLTRSMTLPASQQPHEPERSWTQPLQGSESLQVPTGSTGGDGNRLSDTGLGGPYDRSQYGGGYFSNNE